jgi:hypothetical protein
LDWLRPYALGEKKWEYQQIGGYKKADYYALLMQAAAAYKEPRYTAYVQPAAGKDNGDIIMNILYGK